jgi:triosephosphate isomerase (TIM)
MRKSVIAGNWKMHKNISETKKYILSLKNALTASCEARVLLAVPYTSILTAAELARGTPIEIGAQNMSEHEHGAFTGEISSGMILDCGGSFVLLGHSERRQLFQETSEQVFRKIKKALSSGLQPIVCIGETKEQRANGQTDEVLQRQMQESFGSLAKEEVLKIIVAYEPVWAIGTGQNATPEIAQETHHMCRSFIMNKWDQSVADRLPILYGGSVKPDNIRELMGQKDIDGVLVGGASLEPDNFLKIIQYK